MPLSPHVRTLSDEVIPTPRTKIGRAQHCIAMKAGVPIQLYALMDACAHLIDTT